METSFNWFISGVSTGPSSVPNVHQWLRERLCHSCLQVCRWCKNYRQSQRHQRQGYSPEPAEFGNDWKTVSYKNQYVLSQMYKFLVRLHLEFSMSTCLPYYRKDKHLLERIHGLRNQCCYAAVAVSPSSTATPSGQHRWTSATTVSSNYSLWYCNNFCTTGMTGYLRGHISRESFFFLCQ